MNNAAKPATVTRQFRPGECLFREGEKSDAMFLIQQGTISIQKAKGGGQIEIAKVYSQEVIGELSFFDRKPRSASAVAVSEVTVMEISFDGLDKIYGKVPDYLKTIMSSVADRLRRANDQIRKLQKDLIEEGTRSPSASDFSATDALAAIEDLNQISDMPVTDPGVKE